MKTRVSQIAAILIYVFGSGLSQTAVGQAESEKSPLQEIVVTAQIREQSLQDVPISITSVTGDFIQSNAIARLEDLTALMPNVSITEAFTTDFITIRGINSGINIGFEQSVGTFIDGVYFGRDAQSRARLLDTERLEVLRGPQSTYFGNNTIGGALSVTTRKPGDVFEGYVRGHYGATEKDYDLEIAGGGPLSDTFGLRGAAKFNGYEGFLTNRTQGGRKEPDEESEAYRITGVWTPNERFDATLKAEYSKFEQLGSIQEATDCPQPQVFADAGVVAISCGLTLGGAAVPPFDVPDPTFEDEVDGNSHRGENAVGNKGGVSALGDFGQLETHVYALTMNYDFSDHTLTSITAYNDYSTKRGTDIDQLPISFIVVNNPTDFDQFSQELRITSPMLGQFEYIAGAYYQSSTVETPEVIAVALDFPFPGGIQQYNFFEQDSETFAIFGSLTWYISDAWRMTFGGRYTDVEKDAKRRQTLSRIATNPDPATGVPDPTLDGNLLTGTFSHPLLEVSREDSEFTPAINFQYDWTDDVMIYGSYAEGFKAGGFDQRALDGSEFLLGFQPENVDAYEFGAKTTWLDGRLDANIAVFYSQYDNLQVSEYRGSGLLFFVRNAASAIIRGVELETRWAISDRWTANLGIAYLDAYYDDWPNGPCHLFDLIDPDVPSCSAPEPDENPSKDASGGVLTYAPDWSGSLAVDYVAPMSNGLEFFADVTVPFSTEFSTRADNDPRLYGGKVHDKWDGLERNDSAIKSKPYAKLNARIGVRGDRWEVAFVGKNLTDVKTVNQANGVPSSPGTRYRALDRQRYFLVQASYLW